MVGCKPVSYSACEIGLYSLPFAISISYVIRSCSGCLVYLLGANKHLRNLSCNIIIYKGIHSYLYKYKLTNSCIYFIYLASNTIIQDLKTKFDFLNIFQDYNYAWLSIANVNAIKGRCH